MQTAPPRNRMIKNVYNFFRHGVFNITYPKLTRPQLSNSQSTPIAVEEKQETAEEEAKRLLKRIDERLQGANEDGGVAAVVSNSKDAAAAVTPGAAVNAGEQRKQAWQSMGQEDDYQSDYDYEFSSSRHNRNYRKHYKQLVSDSEGEEDDDDDGTRAGGAYRNSGGGFYSDEDEQTAEEQALLTRARTRLDSHDVNRSHSHGHHGHSHAPGEECPMHKKSAAAPITGLTVTPTVLSMGDRG